MGNEGSQLSGLEIEENVTEVTDFWAQYQAKINNSCNYFSLKSDGSVSVFKGEAVMGPLWAISTPLEKFSNNLLKYRHPCIVRYISAWQQRSTLHLATEFVQPLSHVLDSQNPLQICIGLNNILRALVFLHEQAGMSHNNVCISAIYVTGDGQWKLGGLQYLHPFAELTSAYLKHARIHRYDKAVDPNEDSHEINTKVDQYAFAVLVEDVLKGCNNDDVPHLEEFKFFCQDSLQHCDPNCRPKLSEVLQHSFFNHEFISVYKFLNFLPLKSEEEKVDFFSNVLKTLTCYDEETVAKQLIGLLLSRLTMLDQTAKQDVIPYILKPRNERLQNCENIGFFSLHIFKEHVKPRLLQLFGVRDTSIRLLLLTHFSKFVHVFTHEELSQHILPEVLLGIKDVDDSLVSKTLICLSELVPILGADTVVGGKRSKIFIDGRPNSKNDSVLKVSKFGNTTKFSSKSLEDFACSEQINHSLSLPTHERPSPVGGEAIDDEFKTVESKSAKILESEDDWSDWDSTNRHLSSKEQFEAFNDVNVNNGKESSLEEHNLISIVNLPEKGTITELIDSNVFYKAALEAKKNITDISDLDIKHQKNIQTKKSVDEFDYFADMMPVIEKQKVVEVEATNLSTKLKFLPDDEGDENEGWSDS